MDKSIYLYKIHPCFKILRRHLRIEMKCSSFTYTYLLVWLEIYTTCKWVYCLLECLWYFQLYPFSIFIFFSGSYMYESNCSYFNQAFGNHEKKIQVFSLLLNKKTVNSFTNQILISPSTRTFGLRPQGLCPPRWPYRGGPGLTASSWGHHFLASER